MAGKRYGRKNRVIASHPFEVVVSRNGQEEIHEFTAYPNITANTAVQMALGGKAGDEAQFVALVNALSRMMSDSDGVPLNWVPKEEGSPPDDPANYDPQFRDPDGNLRPVREVKQFTEHAAGSSRRRWNHLMLVDDEAQLEIDQLEEIARDLIEAAAARPTGAR